jgi:hypothetical protein
VAGPSALVAARRNAIASSIATFREPQSHRLLLSWPAPKVAEYAVAGSVGVGQARRWCTLSGLSRLKQSKFTT